MSRPGAYSVVSADAPVQLPAAVRLLAGMIAVATPEAAAKAARVQELVKLEPTTDSWLHESAALLAPLRSLPLPDAFALLAEVPGCEKIAAILRAEDTKDETVLLGIRALAKATMREERIAEGLPMDEAETAEPTEDLLLPKLRVGMICAEDLLSQSGSVIVPKNAILHAVTLERLRRFAQGAGVREPVRVFAATG